MGENDFFVPANEAKQFYEQIKLKDKNLKFHNSGHELPDEYINDVLDWIVKHN